MCEWVGGRERRVEYSETEQEGEIRLLVDVRV